MAEQPNVRASIIEAIVTVAPDLDEDTIGGDDDLSDDLDLDSMDLYNIGVGIYERTGVDIPESDRPKLRTLDSLVVFVEAAQA